uniref:Carbonic anhydrase n=1 Tax=Kalanchoe fedtschenkoi TaxID=63787 RepID=A0A7N0V1N7_KALFE
MTMMLRRIRNGVLPVSPSKTISAEKSPSYPSGLISKLIRPGSAAVSEGHHVQETDPISPGFRFARKSAMSSSAASLEPSGRFATEPAVDNESLFDDLKRRFLRFKRNNYLKESERYQALARTQNPKFMVVACVDSRVCPSNILGFQPGEAFMVRNMANLVPPPEQGPSETLAALEYAIKTLGIENILVVGHSCCAGIKTLMSMEDSPNLSFVEKWVVTGKSARLSSKSSASHLPFNRQCKYCEKESVSHSMRNLTMYPWIAERVEDERLAIHGGYYDFVSCTFEKWTLAVGRGDGAGADPILIKDRQFWS